MTSFKDLSREATHFYYYILENGRDLDSVTTSITYTKLLKISSDPDSVMEELEAAGFIEFDESDLPKSTRYVVTYTRLPDGEFWRKRK